MRPYGNMSKENTALLVIDVINSCAHEKCEEPDWHIHFSKIRDMVPHLEKFTEDYRNKIGGMVVFVKCTPWRKEYLAENINELYSDPDASYYSDDTSGFPEEFYEVVPQEGDLVIEKNHIDAFTNPELDQKLKEKGIRYLIVTGIFTDGCVLATVNGGFSKGYNFVVLKDLIETTDSDTRQKLQQLLKEYTFPVLYGKTMTSQEFLDSWK